MAARALGKNHDVDDMQRQLQRMAEQSADQMEPLTLILALPLTLTRTQGGSADLQH